MSKQTFYRQFVWLILSLMWVLSSCQTESNIPENNGTPQVRPDETTTVVSSVNTSPISTVVSSITESPVPGPAPEATAIPNPASGKGSVTGRLIWVLKDGQYQANLATLYLGPVLPSEDGIPRLASLNKEEDPVVRTDDFGRFAFMDVEPGTYTLIYSLPGFNEAVIKKLGHEGDFLIVVEAGEITELDEIVADFPFWD